MQNDRPISSVCKAGGAATSGGTKSHFQLIKATWPFDSVVHLNVIPAKEYPESCCFFTARCICKHGICFGNSISLSSRVRVVAHHYAALEANANVNGGGQISHPTASKPLNRFRHCFKYITPFTYLSRFSSLLHVTVCGRF